VVSLNLAHPVYSFHNTLLVDRSESGTCLWVRG